MESITKALTDLKDKHLYRQLREVSGRQGSSVTVAGRECLLFSSNDYLGLASDERVTAAAKDALDEYGFGAGASRLISGTMTPHVELEEEIARFKGTEAALLFNSGYTANIGLISALTGRDDIMFSDKLNHASIVDAALLSSAKVRRYPHRDTAALKRYLNDSAGFKERFIVTDGVFSMDGDIAPLRDIAELAKEYGAHLIVDDAHATGVLGESGKGTLSHLGISSANIIQMGTLSKALGCFGAFIAGNREMIEYLINKARSFIYTTALPPSCAAAATEAVRIAKDGDDLRTALFDNVEYLRDGLKGAGFKLLNDETHIIPLMIGDEKRALDLSRFLFDNGIFIQAIRPPTVPKGTSRLRITPTARHTREDIDRLIETINKF